MSRRWTGLDLTYYLYFYFHIIMHVNMTFQGVFCFSRHLFSSCFSLRLFLRAPVWPYALFIFRLVQYHNTSYYQDLSCSANRVAAIGLAIPCILAITQPPGAGFMNRRRLCQLTAAILTSDLTTQMWVLWSDTATTLQLYSSALAQFGGRARGDDVMGNLTVSKWRASQVTVATLAYRCCDDS